MLDVCDPQVMRGLLAEYGFHFSKSKGQNFLIRRWVPQRIVSESGVDKSCGVLEIGPGFGPLTQELCLRAGKVVALELDRTLAPVLKRTVGEFENLEVLYGDVLKTDLPALAAEKFAGKTPVACANLPYYITSPVLTKLLESRCFAAVTVMVQKEVALRICAKPGSADYSAFTVLCNYHAEPELLFDVPPDCFMPRPKVTSAVIRLKTRKRPPAEISDEALFFRTVRAAFAMRRKTLQNCLAAGFGELDKAQIAEALDSCGIAPNTRGETLGILEFALLAQALQTQRGENADVPNDISGS